VERGIYIMDLFGLKVGMSELVHRSHGNSSLTAISYYTTIFRTFKNTFFNKLSNKENSFFFIVELTNTFLSHSKPYFLTSPKAPHQINQKPKNSQLNNEAKIVVPSKNKYIDFIL